MISLADVNARVNAYRETCQNLANSFVTIYNISARMEMLDECGERGDSLNALMREAERINDSYASAVEAARGASEWAGVPACWLDDVEREIFGEIISKPLPSDSCYAMTNAHGEECFLTFGDAYAMGPDGEWDSYERPVPQF